MSPELWIMLIASLGALSCALVGCLLVLRRMAMLGDAISHSILFGIVVAYLITQSRSPWIMGMGALIVGLLTTYLSNFLHLRGKLQEDASIGIVFTWLFALGVILISLFAGQIDLDQDCVLYGELAFTPFDTVTLFGREIGPRAFWMLLVVSIFNICCITIGYRKLKLCAFDPLLARSLGIRVEFWHYLLMSLVSLSTVAAFESVGAILVVALLVVPANTAFLFASSLIGMLALASLFGIGSALSGYWLASYFDASISASIALMGGAFFVMALLASQLGIFRHKVGHPV